MSWTRSSSPHVETSVQAYYHDYVRDQNIEEVQSFFSERWRIFDVEMRRRRVLTARHEIVGGVGYRLWSVDVVNTPQLSMLPSSERTYMMTGFIQDEVGLSSNIWFTPGEVRAQSIHWPRGSAECASHMDAGQATRTLGSGVAVGAKPGEGGSLAFGTDGSFSLRWWDAWDHDGHKQA